MVVDPRYLDHQCSSIVSFQKISTPSHTGFFGFNPTTLEIPVCFILSLEMLAFETPLPLGISNDPLRVA